MGIGATVTMALAFVLSGVPARAGDTASQAQIEALQKAVDDLRAEIQTNHQETLERLGKLRAGQQTMIRRGVVIAPNAAEVPLTVGKQTILRLGDAPSLGDPHAPVEVVEFGEFQCPYCIKASGFLRELAEKYPGKVRVGFRHFPIGRHKMAVDAAKAAWAAGEQGKFWEMYDLLFLARGKLAPEAVRGYAESLGLDMEKYDRDVASAAATRAVFRDRRAARAAGVKGTPSYFVNGRFYGGSPSMVRKVVEREVAGGPPGADSGG